MTRNPFDSFLSVHQNTLNVLADELSKLKPLQASVQAITAQFDEIYRAGPLRRLRSQLPKTLFNEHTALIREAQAMFHTQEAELREWRNQFPEIHHVTVQREAQAFADALQRQIQPSDLDLASIYSAIKPPALFKAIADQRAKDQEWFETVRTALDASSAYRKVFDSIQPSLFNSVVAATAEDFNVEAARHHEPVSAADIHKAVRAADVSALKQVLMDATASTFTDTGAPKPPPLWLTAVVLPLLVAIVGGIVTELLKQWISPSPREAPTSLVAPATTVLYVVTSDDVYLRSGPDTRQRSVTVTRAGDIVHLVKTNGQWSYVTLRKQDPAIRYAGWIKTKYLRSLESVAFDFVRVELLAGALDDGNERDAEPPKASRRGSRTIHAKARSTGQ